MTIAKQIENAIARSVKHNEIVHITIDGDSGDALAAIRTVFTGNTDYTMYDREGVDTLDVWGWTDETPENDQDWRLSIRFDDRNKYIDADGDCIECGHPARGF